MLGGLRKTFEPGIGIAILLGVIVAAAPAAAQTDPPATLGSMRIAMAALISPDQAASYYGSGTVSTDGLAGISGQPNPTSVRPEIVELARALKNNVDLIYQYAHDNVDVNWMYGLQKGALGTLIDKSGTPFDQADLMVKLLRQSGYTAKFVSGTIQLSGAQFYQWTGIQDSNAACQMLAAGGIPAKIDASTTMSCATGTGSSIGTITMRHIWVQAAIPGSTCGTICLFDPSFKSYSRPAGIALPAATGMSSGQPLSTATAGMDSGAVSGVPFVHNLNLVSLNAQLATYTQNLLNSLYSNSHDADTLETVLGGPTIQPDQAPAGGWRQTQLAYSVVGTPTTWTGTSRTSIEPRCASRLTCGTTMPRRRPMPRCSISSCMSTRYTAASFASTPILAAARRTSGRRALSIRRPSTPPSI